MTLADYMNAEKFPLTTQKGLSERQQFMIDAFNCDAIREHVVGTPELTPAMEHRYAELEAKVAAQPALLRELAGAGHWQAWFEPGSGGRREPFQESLEDSDAG